MTRDNTGRLIGRGLRAGIVMAACVMAGCSEGGYVSGGGTVQLDGKPLDNATVVFAPDPPGPDRKPATAITGPDGRFTLQTNLPGSDTVEGIQPGDYKVTVSKFIPPNNMTDAEYEKAIQDAEAKNPTYSATSAVPERVELIPKAYSASPVTQLKETVTDDGPNDFQINIPK